MMSNFPLCALRAPPQRTPRNPSLRHAPKIYLDNNLTLLLLLGIQKCASRFSSASLLSNSSQSNHRSFLCPRNPPKTARLCVLSPFPTVASAALSATNQIHATAFPTPEKHVTSRKPTKSPRKSSNPFPATSSPLPRSHNL